MKVKDMETFSTCHKVFEGEYSHQCLVISFVSSAGQKSKTDASQRKRIAHPGGNMSFRKTASDEAPHKLSKLVVNDFHRSWSNQEIHFETQPRKNLLMRLKHRSHACSWDMSPGAFARIVSSDSEYYGRSVDSPR